MTRKDTPMYRYAVALLMLALLMTTTPVFAEEAEWSAGTPKRGEFSMYCMATHAAEGHRYTYQNYISGDLDQPRASEIAFMTGACERFTRTDVARWFSVRGVTIDPASVRVTTRLSP